MATYDTELNLPLDKMVAISQTIYSAFREWNILNFD